MEKGEQAGPLDLPLAVDVASSAELLDVHDARRGDALDKLLRLSIALIREIPEILILADRRRNFEPWQVRDRALRLADEVSLPA